MPDYSKGKIYKIECNITGEVYYGSTTQHYLCDRIGSHRPSRRNYSSRSIIERGNYNYKVIEYYPCDNKKELETQERWWIENNVCINKNIPTRTDKEWRDENKDKLYEYKKQYYKDTSNKEHHLANCKKYKEEHKEELNKKQKEKFTCECGVIYARTNKARHIKSKKHQDFISCHTDNP